MPVTYAATILNDIDHPGFPLKSQPGNWWGTVASCISRYDPLNDRIQIGGHTYSHDGTAKGSYYAGGYWEVDIDDIAVVDGKGVPPGKSVTRSAVKGMNNLYPSVKVGWINTNNIDRKLAVRWDQSGMKKLGSLGGVEGCANDINDLGQIVGYTMDGYGNKRAFIWSEGEGPIIGGQSPFIELGTLGGNNSEATAINNHGQVVGWAEDEQGLQHPFIWSFGANDGVPANKRMKDLLIGPYITGIARDINDNGNVVGAVGEFPSIQGFFWSAAAGTYILPNIGGPTTVAQAVNNKDEIVGYSCDVALNIYPVKWDNLMLTNLTNYIVKPYPSMEIGSAQDINDDGNIVCTANLGGITVSILLTELYIHHYFPPVLYRRNLELMGGMQNAVKDPVPGPDGRLIQLKPPGRNEKKKDDANLLQLMAITALSLNDEELRTKIYSSLTKSGRKKAKKVRKVIKKQNKKR